MELQQEIDIQQASGESVNPRHSLLKSDNGLGSGSSGHAYRIMYLSSKLLKYDEGVGDGLNETKYAGET